MLTVTCLSSCLMPSFAVEIPSPIYLTLKVNGKLVNNIYIDMILLPLLLYILLPIIII